MIEITKQYYMYNEVIILNMEGKKKNQGLNKTRKKNHASHIDYKNFPTSRG